MIVIYINHGSQVAVWQLCYGWPGIISTKVTVINIKTPRKPVGLMIWIHTSTMCAVSPGILLSVIYCSWLTTDMHLITTCYQKQWMAYLRDIIVSVMFRDCRTKTPLFSVCDSSHSWDVGYATEAITTRIQSWPRQRCTAYNHGCQHALGLDFTLRHGRPSAACVDDSVRYRKRCYWLQPLQKMVLQRD